MTFGTNIRTFWQGRWHDEDLPVMRAADHGIWQGSSVFDGARFVNGLCPDLAKHCARVNASAEALMITPTVDTGKMEQIIRDGLRAYGPDQAVYVRPMYWAIDGGDLGINPMPNSTAFAVSLEQVAMPADSFHPHPLSPPGVGR
jgi:branched-chain amino acid aminotransferase